MRFARRLLPLSRRFRAAVDQALSGFGLSSANGWALLHVSRLGDDVPQGDLVAELDVQGASVVRLIDQLEAAGLLARAVDERDRRVNRLRLTPAGHALVGRIEEALAAIRARLMAFIDDADLAVANKVMEQIDRNLADLREAAR
jgi:MarR family transcriptional regulator for hemolysin